MQTTNLYQDDAVKSKASRWVPERLNFRSQSVESTSEEVIKSDDEPGKSTDEASVHQSSASSVESDLEYLKSTPVKDANIVRLNHKLNLNESQILRALGTFSMPKQCNIESNKAREPSSNETSQASRITDSAPDTNLNIDNYWPKPSRGRPKNESGKSQTKTGPDADLVNMENGPVTRSKGKTLATQQSQQQSNEIVIDPKEGGVGFVSQSQAPSGSSIVINRLKKLYTH